MRTRRTMRTSEPVNAVGSIPKVVEGPCAWQDRYLTNNPDWIVHWTADQVAELERAAEHFASTVLTLENYYTRELPSPKTNS